MKKQTIFVGLLMLAFTTTHLEASCGTFSCPLVKYPVDSDKKLEFGVSYEYIQQDLVYVGSNLSSVGAISQHHDEVKTWNRQTTFSMDYLLDKSSRVRVELPFINKYHEHIHNHMGTPIPESWTLNGIGDVSLFLDQFLYSDRHAGSYISATFGTKLPTGVTRLKNDAGSEAEVTLQPGSGSVDFNLGLFGQTGVLSVPNLENEFTQIPLKCGVSYTIFGEGTDGWSYGKAWVWMIGTHYSPLKSLTLGVDGIVKSQDKANAGKTGESTANTGGDYAYIAPNVEYQIMPQVSMKVQTQFPIYQRVNGIQLVSPWNLKMDLKFAL